MAGRAEQDTASFIKVRLKSDSSPLSPFFPYPLSLAPNLKAAVSRNDFFFFPRRDRLLCKTSATFCLIPKHY